MTNENLNVAQEEAAKPKRSRRVTPKVEKTAVEIITELNVLEAQVIELENAIGAIDVNSAAYAIIEKALEDKKAALEAAKTKIYFS